MAWWIDDSIIILQKGWTALMAAAKGDREDIVQILIDHGASLEMKMTVSHSQCLHVELVNVHFRMPRSKLVRLPSMFPASWAVLVLLRCSLHTKWIRTQPMR